MLFKYKTPLLSLLILLTQTTGVAANSLPQHESILLAPTCLVKNLTTYATIYSNAQYALIKTDSKGVTEAIAAKANHKKLCGGFMDVTTQWNVTKSSARQFVAQMTESAPKAQSKVEYSIRYPAIVNKLIATLDAAYLENRLKEFSSYKDRFSNSSSGVQAAHSVRDEIEAYAAQMGRTDIDVYYVSTGFFKQPSLVVKFGTSNEPGIVIGAHLDTLSGSRSPKPGADDDGSGSVDVLEIARTIIGSGMTFKKPIYFIWYSAEEMGLIGSQKVVSYFQQNNIPVATAVQFDMTGYNNDGTKDPTLWLIDDYVDADLTQYLEKLITTYVHQPVKHTTCGYACSDHASWSQNGYTAAMPFEAEFGHDNPNIHSSNDTMDYISINHMKDFAALGVAYAVEMAEPL
jgi:leucyl aminopeptidase